jgi:hypothetical protein
MIGLDDLVGKILHHIRVGLQQHIRHGQILRILGVLLDHLLMFVLAKLFFVHELLDHLLFHMLGFIEFHDQQPPIDFLII